MMSHAMSPLFLLTYRMRGREISTYRFGKSSRLFPSAKKVPLDFPVKFLSIRRPPKPQQTPTQSTTHAPTAA